MNKWFHDANQLSTKTVIEVIEVIIDKPQITSENDLEILNFKIFHRLKKGETNHSFNAE